MHAILQSTLSRGARRNTAVHAACRFRFRRCNSQRTRLNLLRVYRERCSHSAQATAATIRREACSDTDVRAGRAHERPSIPMQHRRTMEQQPSQDLRSILAHQVDQHWLRLQPLSQAYLEHGNTTRAVDTLHQNLVAYE